MYTDIYICVCEPPSAFYGGLNMVNFISATHRWISQYISCNFTVSKATPEKIEKSIPIRIVVNYFNLGLQ